MTRQNYGGLKRVMFLLLLSLGLTHQTISHTEYVNSNKKHGPFKPPCKT